MLLALLTGWSGITISGLWVLTNAPITLIKNDFCFILFNNVETKSTIQPIALLSTNQIPEILFVSDIFIISVLFVRVFTRLNNNQSF